MVLEMEDKKMVDESNETTTAEIVKTGRRVELKSIGPVRPNAQTQLMMTFSTAADIADVQLEDGVKASVLLCGKAEVRLAEGSTWRESLAAVGLRAKAKEHVILMVRNVSAEMRVLTASLELLNEDAVAVTRSPIAKSENGGSNGSVAVKPVVEKPAEDENELVNVLLGRNLIAPLLAYLEKGTPILPIHQTPLVGYLSRKGNETVVPIARGRLKALLHAVRHRHPSLKLNETFRSELAASLRGRESAPVEKPGVEASP